jgi:hypothetical protein
LGIGDGSEFLQPLGVVVFSGLSLATMLTLFIIPCFYILLHDFFGIFAGKKKPQDGCYSCAEGGEKDSECVKCSVSFLRTSTQSGRGLNPCLKAKVG